MKYKAGDKVRIKSLAELEKYNPNMKVGCMISGLWFSSYEMYEFTGNIITITGVNIDGWYESSDTSIFVWNDDMISGLASDTPLLPSRIYSPLANITIQELAEIIPHLIAGTIPSEDEVISRHWKILN